MRIRYKIFFPLLIVIVFPIFIADKLFFDFFKQEVVKEQFSKLDFIASSKVSSIQTYFHERITDLHELQQNTVVINNILSLTNNKGRKSSSVNELRNNLDKELRPFQKTTGFQDIMLINPSGLVLFSTNPVHYENEVERLMPSFKNKSFGKKMPDNFISNIRFDDRPEHGYELYISGPIFGHNKELLGTILFEMNLDVLYKILLDTSGSRVSGETILTRLDGDDQALVLNPLRHDDDAALKRVIKFNNPNSIPFQNALQGKNGSGMVLDYRGKPVICAWRYLPELQWGIVINIDQDEALSSLNRLKKITMFIVVFSLIAVLMASIIISKNLIKPIEILRDGARRLAEDDLDFRVSTKGKDEISQLAVSFNEMAASLANSRLKLEEKVAIRTAELETLNQELTILTRAVKQSPVAIIITDNNALIQYVNPFFTTMTDYTLEDIQAKPFKILEDDKYNQQYKEMWSSVKTGSMWHGEIQNRGKDGGLFWVRRSVAPIFDKSEKTTNFVIILEDIKEQKKSEELRNAQIDELHNMQRAMLNMLDDLEESNIKATAASKAKSDFLANMSHEIRTPMNAIIGMTYLAIQTGPNHQQLDYLEKIDNSAQSLMSIINDILDFSKIEAGKMEMEQTEFNLNTLVDHVIIQSSEIIAAKNIELLLNIDHDIPETLIGDPVRVSQIFSNLLSNAAKFTTKGDIEISARVINRSKDILLECVISDSGIGMSKAQIANIFKQFTQGNTSTTRKYGGTGLGLAICAQLVELMGGDIRVESLEGQGSKFIFTLSLGYREDRIGLKTRLILPLNLQNIRVLVLVGHDKLREGIVKLLGSLNLKTNTASNCHIAYEKIQEAVKQKSPFGLVIADFKVIDNKKRDTATILSCLKLSLTPFLMMVTVNDTIAAGEHANESPLVHIITKPPSVSSLYNSIVEIFGCTPNEIGDTDDSPNHYNSDIGGTKVLLVEDSVFNQQVASEILKQAGVQVTIANNGKKAVYLVQKNHYDLVLMDVEMPVMDGLLATKTIRALGGNFATLPIVAMTANAMASDRKKSLAAGMNDHLTKPFDPAELYACLAKLTNKRQSILPTDKKTDDNRLKELAKMTGIDIESGLMRLLNNSELYCRIMIDFAKNTESFKAQLQEALTIDNYEEAKLLVHTMKGTAATIGAEKIRELASTLEGYIQNRKKDINKKTAELVLALHELSSTILKILPPPVLKPTKTINANALDNKGMRKELDKLSELLTLNSMEASRLFDSLKNDLYGLWPEEVSNSIDTALENFDFKTARKVLKTFLDTEF